MRTRHQDGANAPSQSLLSSRPKVTVVLAAYNGARFLQQQLKSLKEQTYRPLELIARDDRSTDQTAAVIREFSAIADFPVNFRTNDSRLHYAENFLQAALESTGDYIAFCDQDDIWNSEKLQRCVNALETTPDALLCSHDAELIDESGNSLGLFQQLPPGIYPRLSLSPWNVLFGFSMVFRRELLNLIHPSERGADNIEFSRPLSHDRWIYLLAQSFGGTVYLNRPLVQYRQHNENVCGSGRSSGASLGAIRRLISRGGSDLEHHLNISRQRSAMFRRFSAVTGQADANMIARQAEVYWAKLEQIYLKRLLVATSRNPFTKVRAIADLFKLSAYATFEKGGLTRRALAKDLANLFTSTIFDTTVKIHQQA